MRRPDWVPPLRPRPVDAHKGSMGKLLVVGGSLGLTGAVVLAAEAALRSGVGMVQCAVPASQQPIIAIKTTEAMTIALADAGRGTLDEHALAGLRPRLAEFDALLLGPGLGRDESTTRGVAALLDRLEVPHIVDADGLWHLARLPALLAAGSPARVLTPHAVEMERLLGPAGFDGNLPAGTRAQTAREFAARIPGVLVLKGPGTLIAAGADLNENPSGNSGMAKGGSGDVLAGIIGAFLARGDSPAAAARRAVWLHGLAGDLAAARLGRESMLPSDIIGALSEAFREVEDSWS